MKLHMKIKDKFKNNRFFTVMVIPDAKYRPTTFKVPRWSLFSIVGVLTAVCLMIFGMLTYIHSLRSQLVRNESIAHGYCEQLEDSVNTIKKLEADVDYYEGELQSIMEVVHSLNERTLGITTQNSHIIGRIGDLLGVETNHDKGEDNPSLLSSRSGNRPKPIMNNGAFQQNHILALDEFVVIENRVSHAESSNIQLKDKVTEMEQYLLAYPSIFPVEGRITCNMGERSNPFSKNTKEFHNGLDLAAKIGTDVKATGMGKVIFSGYNGGYGNLVIIDHGFNIKTYYAHNSKLLVEDGDRVKRGDIVAKSGNTGRSTGPHVHYEVRVKNVPKDPLDFVLNFEKGDE